MGLGGVAGFGDSTLALATVGTTRVKSSCALVGLLGIATGTGAAGLGFAGLTRGEGADLLVTSLDGEGRLDSLAVAVCPGLVL